MRVLTVLRWHLLSCMKVWCQETGAGAWDAGKPPPRSQEWLAAAADLAAVGLAAAVCAGPAAPQRS